MGPGQFVLKYWLFFIETTLNPSKTVDKVINAYDIIFTSNYH
jgi:hypothetical protein